MNEPPQASRAALSQLSEGQAGTPAERPVWVLLGRRTGDNNQLLAAARALGLPFDALQLRFRGVAMPNVLIGKRLRGVANPEVLPRGNPELVLSIGRRSPPVARWIRQRSGGRTRLVHFGRPWGPTGWFDLVVTTAQYRLAPRSNLICKVLPFLAPPSAVPIPVSLEETFRDLPRPWTVVLAGGNSRPYVFDRRAALALAAHCNESVQRHGGSLLFLPSPRTPDECVSAIEPLLRGPAFVYARARHENPYRALLSQGDRFIVTSDSALMVAEALAAARPVEVFELPREPDFRYRCAMALRAAAARNAGVDRAYQWLRDLGLLNSTRDLGEYFRTLRELGLFDSPELAAEVGRQEREQTIARIRALLG